MNPTDSLALNDEPSESESDEPCPGSGGLYQDEDWISWRHNNSSGENSEVSGLKKKMFERWNCNCLFSFFFQRCYYL
jgi:hypothetical protein